MSDALGLGQGGTHQAVPTCVSRFKTRLHTAWRGVPSPAVSPLVLFSPGGTVGRSGPRVSDSQTSVRSPYRVARWTVVRLKLTSSSASSLATMRFEVTLMA